MSSGSSSQATVVGGRIYRDESSNSRFSPLSMRRLFLVLVVLAALAITNPANRELADRAMDLLEDALPDNLLRRNDSRQRGLGDWAWNNMLDPPISVTNYGLFAMEERHAALVVSGMATTWSCNYFDERIGSFCSSAANHLCHGKPLLWYPESLAYTAHRIVCFLLVGSALLSFCCAGNLGSLVSSEPLLRTLFLCVGRPHYSPFSLLMDLFNASMFVYPALVRMERIVPTLDDGIAYQLGLPSYVDYIIYVLALVIFIGGGSNAMATLVTKQPCSGFDAVVAAAVAYCTVIPWSPLVDAVKTSSISQAGKTLLSPHTTFWGYLPITAMLGGSGTYVIAWILSGMSGVMLGQYHLDNQNWVLAAKQLFKGKFSFF